MTVYTNINEFGTVPAFRIEFVILINPVIFAREGAIDAVNTGRNQIFLSASKSQVFQFRQYIIDFSMAWIGI